MMTSCFDHTEIEDWRGVLSSRPFLSRRFLVKSLPFGQGLMWNLFFLEHCSSTKRFRGTDRIWWIFLCEKSWPLYLEPPSIFLILAFAVIVVIVISFFNSILHFTMTWVSFFFSFILSTSPARFLSWTSLVSCSLNFWACVFCKLC